LKPIDNTSHLTRHKAGYGGLETPLTRHKADYGGLKNLKTLFPSKALGPEEFTE
jgi:hypothetical protein